MLSEYAEANGYKVVNYGEYLSLHEPEYEVTLNEGNRGEGTSWSCIHGVARWKKNCGCHTGGHDGWNQRWRRHLRNAFNQLNGKLGILFELEGKKYFKNVWNARNDYIDIILKGDRKGFFAEHAIKKLSKADTEKAIELLEMQRYSMLMFTSCGWFFSEISGIESVKVLEYAKRAMELGERISGISLHDEFLDELEKAKSNIAEYKNGKEIYLNLGMDNNDRL